MNKGMLTVGIILLSLIALLMLGVMSNFSTGSEVDYYLLKETTDAALEDAIDQIYLRTCGLYRIDKDKFVENFLYRFANSVEANRDYRIRFYDINEVPPKVSVKVDSLTVLSVKGREGTEAATISQRYDAIIEAKYFNDLAVEEGLNTPNSDLCKSLCEISDHKC